MMEHKNLDRLFQEKFKDFEVKPPEEVWNAIEVELNKEKKKRIIPLWWKFSGVAALLIIGALLYSTFTDEKLNTKPEFNPDSNNVVLENQKDNEAQKDSNGIEINESNLDETKNKSIAPVKNPVRNNQTVTDISQERLNKNKKGTSSQSKNDSSLNSWDENYKQNNSKQSEIISENNAIVLDPDKEKNQNSELTNLNNKQSSGIQKTISESETGFVITENQSKFDLNKYKTAEEINKMKEIDSTVVTAVAEANVEPNALEELLKEKEKEEKSTEPKINRWLVTSAVAPVYFNSASNGSPIDSQFENNSKDYENSLTFGLGVQYALSKKLTVRSGLNQVSMGYNTNDVMYYASLGKSEMNNLNTSNAGASIVVMSKISMPDVSFSSFTENNSTLNTNEGVLNQQMGYLEMPLEVSYKLLDKKFGIQFIGGISTLFLTENQVIVRSPGFEFDLGEANNLNQVHFSSNVGIGFNYTFWKSFQANFEPMFKYQLNTFSNDAGNFKPYFIGLYSGVSYRF